MKTLSIIVVTLNEAAHIPRLKASIDHLDLPDDFSIETILIDGGSKDGTSQTAKDRGFSQVIVLPDANIPVCRNTGIKEASGNWLAFVDGDCELTENWLQTIHPLTISEHPTILGWPAAPPLPRTWVQESWWFHWCNKNQAPIEKMNGVPCIEKEAFRLITTRNIILNRKAYELVDGFNENLPTGEDTDFVFRATLAGATVLAIPEMQVYHYEEPTTLFAFFKQQLWHANRASYQQIASQHGKKIGANAPRFTYFFLLSALITIGSVLVAILLHPIFLAGLLPLLAIVTLPALRICHKGHSLRPFLQLCILYATYGTARSIDLLGLHPRKATWK